MAGPTKRARVLDIIERRGPLEPGEVSRRMGLRPKDIHTTLTGLVADGVLIRDGVAYRFRDYRPTLHRAVQDLPPRRVRDWRADAVAAAMREASDPERDADGYVVL
ncbi:hypothetical protein [Microlunatus sp. Y2014]|uniref:hypothetical protein n=1 Tax=Microlunatus sp. Y2014 TaxID=3418488 RepID=UPI003DA79DCF